MWYMKIRYDEIVKIMWQEFKLINKKYNFWKIINKKLVFEKSIKIKFDIRLSDLDIMTYSNKTHIQFKKIIIWNTKILIKV